MDWTLLLVLVTGLALAGGALWYARRARWRGGQLAWFGLGALLVVWGHQILVWRRPSGLHEDAFKAQWEQLMAGAPVAPEPVEEALPHGPLDLLLPILGFGLALILSFVLLSWCARSPVRMERLAFLGTGALVMVAGFYVLELL